jgi:hypothetical protein
MPEFWPDSGISVVKNVAVLENAACKAGKVGETPLLLHVLSYIAARRALLFNQKLVCD